uniref:Transmembrane protein n=1 Tax=Pediastrum duplex TaxID=3105 RepID=A0A1W6F7N3_PEDDU|nr:hypothetical protein [Pediastrum duplex]ARK36701.1 hypothetical protein [Pediastrum duplex]
MYLVLWQIAAFASAPPKRSGRLRRSESSGSRQEPMKQKQRSKNWLQRCKEEAVKQRKALIFFLSLLCVCLFKCSTLCCFASFTFSFLDSNEAKQERSDCAIYSFASSSSFASFLQRSRRACASTKPS